MADVPDPGKSTLGANWPVASPLRNYIAVEGWNYLASGDSAYDSEPDPSNPHKYGDYQVIVKKSDGTALANASICLDFTPCPDVTLSKNQTIAGAAGPRTVETITCAGANGVVCGIADINGSFTFRIVGKGNAPLPAAPNVAAGALACDPGCVTVTANLYPIGTLRAAIFDISGGPAPNAATNTHSVSGTDASQTSIEASRSASQGNCGRARGDYNADGVESGSDASVASIMGGHAGAGTTGSRNTGWNGGKVSAGTANFCP